MCYMDKSWLFPFLGEEQENPLFIPLAGREICSPHYRIYRKKAEESVLCYVWGGEGYLKMQGGVVKVSEGDVFLLLKGTEHSYSVNPEKPWKVSWFNITGDFFLDIVSAYHLHAGIFPKSSNSLIGLFERGMKSCFDAQQAKKLSSIQMELNCLLLQIVQTISKEYPIAVSNEMAENVKRFIDEQLQNHPEQKMDLRNLAEKFSLSYRQCTRIFEKEYGLTPYEYYTSKKAKLSKQFVLNTTLPIKEISERLGFCDAYYFSAFFKKYFHVSPGKMRGNKEQL